MDASAPKTPIDARVNRRGEQSVRRTSTVLRTRYSMDRFQFKRVPCPNTAPKDLDAIKTSLSVTGCELKIFVNSASAYAIFPSSSLFSLFSYLKRVCNFRVLEIGFKLSKM